MPLHAAIAVDASDEGLLGLADATCLPRCGGKRTSKGSRAFADKESQRWLDAGISAAGLAAAGAACVTVAADRAGDGCETFALRPAESALVIRAQQDRTLADGTLLSRCLDAVAEMGRETVALPAGPGRRARTATLALRAARAPARAQARQG